MPREGLLAVIPGLNEWLPGLAQGGTFLTFHAVRMELILCHFPNDMFHS